MKMRKALAVLLTAVMLAGIGATLASAVGHTNVWKQCNWSTTMRRPQGNSSIRICIVRDKGALKGAVPDWVWVRTTVYFTDGRVSIKEWPLSNGGSFNVSKDVSSYTLKILNTPWGEKDLDLAKYSYQLTVQTGDVTFY